MTKKKKAKMQAVTGTAYCDIDQKSLEGLLEVFSSQFSLEDITSAYRQARHDINLAGEILCGMSGSASSTNIGGNNNEVISKNATSCKLSIEPEGATEMSQQLSSGNVSPKSDNGEQYTRPLKPKTCPVSMGTIASMIAKDYVNPWPSRNNFETSKPMKVDSKELPESEIFSQDVSPNMMSRNGAMNTDVEEFLFKMLGEGFQLDKNTIRQVLGFSGYDVQKSMDKLLELSASTLEKCDDIVGEPAESVSSSLNIFEYHIALRKVRLLIINQSTGKCPELVVEEQLQHLNLGKSDKMEFMTRNLTRSSKTDRDKVALQKEVLEALFNVPERSEEAPKRIRLLREVRRSKAFGKLVVEPFKETSVDCTTTVLETQKAFGEGTDDDENSYEALRKAVKEYWIMMKEYYKSAVDAFAKGDYERSNRLLAQGNFFNEKAREADEKSIDKLIEAREEEIVSLDLHLREPKEAIRLLRLQLSSFCGIPTMKYLRVFVGNPDEDTTKGARKRLITKLLEKESIDWIEEGNGSTILIQVDVIDPKRLSFAKNKLSDH